MLNLIKEYAYKRADLLKLEATEKAVSIIGTMAVIILSLFSALFFIILFLFGIGFLIGTYLQNYGYGLLIVAGFYLLIILALYLRRKEIKNYIANKIVESIEED